MSQQPHYFTIVPTETTAGGHTIKGLYEGTCSCGYRTNPLMAKAAGERVQLHFENKHTHLEATGGPA